MHIRISIDKKRCCVFKIRLTYLLVPACKNERFCICCKRERARKSLTLEAALPRGCLHCGQRRRSAAPRSARRGRSAPAGIAECRRTIADNAQRGTRATSRAELPPATTAPRVSFRRSLGLHPVILVPKGGIREKSACHSVCHVSQVVMARTLVPQDVKNAH